MATLISHLWDERRRLFTFGAIGLASLGLSVGLYALVSRVLWVDGPRTFEYTLVTIVVTWCNYEANRFFTFAKKTRDAGSVGRFMIVALIATCLNSLFFWIGHILLHVADFAMIVINTFLIAIFTFTSHRLFTFHERPWRMVERFRK